jgi:hypothetical protein
MGRGTTGESLPPCCHPHMYICIYTYVCSERIAKDTPVPLKNGDIITVGDTSLKVQMVPAMLDADENVAGGAGTL